jgi:hypothetical protein
MLTTSFGEDTCREIPIPPTILPDLDAGITSHNLERYAAISVASAVAAHGNPTTGASSSK